jgi:hypothetical protein
MSLSVVLEKRHGSKKQETEQELYLLPRVLGSLDELATRRGWVPLGTFVREDPALFAEMADDLDEETRATIAKKIESQREWHEPSACLTTIEELLAYLKNTDAKKVALDFREAQDDLAVKSILQDEGCTLAEAVCKDLEDCVRRVRQAANSHCGFRFEIG